MVSKDFHIHVYGVEDKKNHTYVLRVWLIKADVRTSLIHE